MTLLKREFFERDSAVVARELLGVTLCRKINDHELTGIITEVEAYFDHTDSASHASKGRTERNAVMFGRGGFSYVYLIYGLHYMFNIVTEKEGRAGAVLLRSVFPVDGMKQMVRFRNGNKRNIADGPGRLCQAFQIDRTLNECDLTLCKKIWLEHNYQLSNFEIETGPRIGIDYAQEKDQKAHLRFRISENDLPRDLVY